MPHQLENPYTEAIPNHFFPNSTRIDAPEVAFSSAIVCNEFLALSVLLTLVPTGSADIGTGTVWLLDIQWIRCIHR